MPPKTSAAQAAHAAGKKRQAALDITAAQEDRVRQALKLLNVTDEEEPRPAAHKAAPPADQVDQVNAVYLALHQQGFDRPHIEAALTALPSLAGVDVAAALDWLLLHLEVAELPRQYIDNSRARGPVELRHKAAQPQAEDEAQTRERQRQEAEAAKAQAAERAAAEAAAAAARGVERRRAEEQEQTSRRAWILQYAEDGSSDESDMQSALDGGSSASGSVVEDWEVWGDPREMERRRAERRRQQLPLEQRLALIAEELHQAKQGGAAAKAAGDKDRQRTCGQVIGYLKKEMAELGVTEDDLPQPGEAEGSPGEQQDGDPTWELPNLDDDAAAENDKTGGGSCDQAPGSLSGEEALCSEAAGAAATGVQGSDSGSEDGGLDFDVFGDDAAQLESVPGTKRKPGALAAAALLPWGMSAGGGKKGGKKGGKPAQEKPPEVQQPKPLLQQVCQQSGWPAPRFERLQPGGGRLGSGVGLRYAAIVDVTGGGRRGGSKSSQQQQRLAQAQGPRKFVLREADDGWERVEEAQAAAATLALLELRGGEEPHMWRRLPPPFNELWLTWQQEGASAGAAPEETPEQEAGREAFVRQLVQSTMQAAAAETAAKAAQAAQGGGDDAGPQQWSQELQRALARPVSDHHRARQRADSDRMLRTLREFRASEEGALWQEQRGRLPVAQIRGEVLQALAEHDAVVVSGETGSGKTTQVPQFVLEAASEAGTGGECSIICTQPRRVAAVSVAERVAEERGEPEPGRPGGRVGYAVRLDSAATADTRLLFCTTGVLLRRLSSDPALAQTSHVVVDEVHERTLQGDFLIALLRDLVVARRAAGRPLKVILMSATLDPGLFATYFGSCPVLHAAGRTFPVQQLFLEDVYEMTSYVLAADAPAALRPGRDSAAGRKRLEQSAGARQAAAVRAGWGDEEIDSAPLNPNYDAQLYDDYSRSTRRNLARVDEDRIDFDLLEELVTAIDEGQGPGAVLVFLPGMAEISALHDRLAASRRFAAGSHWLVPLHSTVAPAEQRKAFQRPPPGVRKIVLATNIAETSVTIEDVVFVVDSGRLKERRHDPTRGMSLLVEDWVSTASANQRRGRAGRVQPGTCYALYTRQRCEHRMKRYQAAEIMRVPLEELVLQIHYLRLAPRAETFLARVLQPPPARAVEGALRMLREVGALTQEERLTPLGHHLAQLPVDARVGKLLLLSACLQCLAPALSIAACLSYKSPFASGPSDGGAGDAARAALAAPGSATLAAGQQSDHLVMAAAVDGWLRERSKGGFKAARAFARKHFLSEQTLEMLADMREQFATMLADTGLVTVPEARGRGRGGKGWVDDPTLPENRFSTRAAMVKAVLLAALYPNVAVMDDSAPSASRRPAWHDVAGEVAIHPSSLCHPLESSRFQRPFLTYLEKVKTSRVFIRDCTVASPAAILLFGGRLEVDHGAGRVLVDGWIRIRAAPQVAVVVKGLRRALEAVLRRKVAAPRAALGEGGGAALVAAIAELLDHEEALQAWDK